MLICVPSYGRDYKTAKEVKEAWAAKKDFTIQDYSSSHNGCQINKQDANAANTTVQIYFCRQTKFTIIKPSKE